nr:GGDEF domain-containing phosphodiesterase [Eubacterium sp.]
MAVFDENNIINYYDTLTGLPNMERFLSSAPGFQSKLAGEGKQSAYISFNLCGLKNYNSKYGLEGGNRLIAELGKALETVFGNDCCSRFGEDHFYVITENSELIKKIKTVFDMMVPACNGFTLPVRAGIYVVKEEDISVIIACDRARVACDWDRNTYGSRYKFFDEYLEEKVKNRDFVLTNFEKALERGDFHVYYQPQIRLLDNRLAGAEALARWIDPDKGLISPGVFIPVLEDSNLTYKLDIYMLKQIIKDLKKCEEKGISKIPISFNLSPNDFKMIEPYSVVKEIVDNSGLSHEWFRVEITETAVVDDPEKVREEIKKFHDDGFEVLMDDFGKGYSSLNTLRDFEFDEIKIDMEFVRKLNHKSKKIITGMVLMAKNLGIHTLMEGVETEEQVEFLRELGCEFVQGYYFGRPEPFGKTDINLKKMGITRESLEERTFFGNVGLVNVVIDQPASLFLFDGEIFYPYYLNEEYKETIFKLFGPEKDVDITLQRIKDSALGERFRTLATKAIRNKRREEIVFVNNNRYFRIICDDIDVCSKGHMVMFIFNEINQDSNEGSSLWYDDILRNIVPVFNKVYLFNFVEDTIEAIVSDNDLEYSRVKTYESGNIFSKGGNVKNIHPDDRNRYEGIFTKEFINNKFKNPKILSFSEYFRIRNKNASKYRLAQYIFIRIPDRAGNVLLCIRYEDETVNNNIIATAKRVVNNLEIAELGIDVGGNYKKSYIEAAIESASSKSVAVFNEKPDIDKDLPVPYIVMQSTINNDDGNVAILYANEKF